MSILNKSDNPILAVWKVHEKMFEESRNKGEPLSDKFIWYLGASMGFTASLVAMGKLNPDTRKLLNEVIEELETVVVNLRSTVEEAIQDRIDGAKH